MCTNENGKPYYSDFHDAYFFYDEIGDTMGPYPTYNKAVKEMKAYAYWLDHGPTLWQRIWWPVRYDFYPKVIECLSSRKDANSLR